MYNYKNHNIDEDEPFFSRLFEVQNFQVDSDSIWIIKISNDRKFIATGGKSGLLKIFMSNDIIEETSPMNIKLNNIKESSVLNNSPSITKKKHIIDFKLIEENAFKVFKGHLNDIIDISWGGNV